MNYIVRVQDHSGDSWELDVINETNVDMLLGAEMLLKDICVSIQEQLEDESNTDDEWRGRASHVLIRKQREIKYIRRRIKHLVDPSGEIAVRNREVTSEEQGARAELNDLLDYLEEYHPDILDKFYEGE